MHFALYRHAFFYNNVNSRLMLLSPLSANPTNTLKQFVGKLPTNLFDHFVGLALKWWNAYLFARKIQKRPSGVFYKKTCS